MNDSWDLAKVGSDAFEHLVNSLAIATLGAGATGFAPGSDGGRDGYFEGEAPYPSLTDRWRGVWYIQSKFHAPHLSKDPQKWLIGKVQEELKEFTRTDSQRKWPDNWIIATNIDPSGTPETGAFDKIRKLIEAVRPNLATRFSIWGGAKIMALLASHPQIAARYSHLLTPADLINQIMSQLSEDRANVDMVLQTLIVRKFKDQKRTKLEQAGSQSDVKPEIQQLFVDLPFSNREHNLRGEIMRTFRAAGDEPHVPQVGAQSGPEWRMWARNPRRANAWFLRGGPGNGKSTLGQYFCQIQRAALILSDAEVGKRILKTHANEWDTAIDVRKAARKSDFWPIAPRIPLHVELKDYAHWYGNQGDGPVGVLTFLANELSNLIEQPVSVGTLKRAIQGRRYVAVFDGLDEVPEDVKDAIAEEVKSFVTQTAVELSCDLLSLCTSRPQGYSGQFNDLECAMVDLLPLPLDIAIACATPVISFQRTPEDSQRAVDLLTSSARSPAIAELLKTPLQAHILAVIVRDGERPPDRRWKLYSRFYDVMRRREANRDLPDRKLARLLANDEKLLKTIHNRVGFRLHADAETSQGAETSLPRSEFLILATRTVAQMEEGNVEDKVAVLGKATTERLVLISTPENGSKLRFDIRQLQEFFAAECLYDSVKIDDLRTRIGFIAGDSHWREVTHFLLSSLIENNRSSELSVAIEQLRRLNDGDVEDDASLNRRAAGGALIAARLLSEGVMDQDRTVRQSFRETLAPMFGFANMARLVPLLTVHQENSHAWLMTFAIEKLRESAPSENIGAAIVLAHRLPNYHPRVAEVCHYLKSASPNYILAVVNSFARLHGDRIQSPIWFQRLMLELLMSPHWIELKSRAINSICWFLRMATNSNPSDLDQLDSTVLPLWPLLTMISAQSVSSESIAIGELVFPQWTVDPEQSELVSAAAAQLSERDAPGIFHLIQAMVRFSQKRDPRDYGYILDTLAKVEGKILGPLQWTVRLPSPSFGDGKRLSEVAKMAPILDQAAFEKLLEEFEQMVPPTETLAPELGFHIETEGMTAADLIACYKHAPVLGLKMLCALNETPGNSEVDRSAVEEFAAAIIGDLTKNSGVVLEVPWCWHPLLTRAGSYGDAILAVIKDACRHALPYHGNSGYHSIFSRRDPARVVHDLFDVFVLTEEPVVLPYISHVILIYVQMRGFGVDDTTAVEIPSSLQASVKMARTSLIEISMNPTQCWSVRCSAALLSLLCARTDEDWAVIDPLSLEFIHNCNSQEGAWLIEGLKVVLTTVGRKQKEPVKKLVQQLFESCREDYAARAELERILMVWREASAAPVTTHSLRDRWLYRSED